MMYLLTSKHCEVKDCQSLMFDFEVWCSTSKFDFEVEVWRCLIFEWKFKVDFENDLCSWRWGLNLKFGADVQCWLLKLTFDVDSDSNFGSTVPIDFNYACRSNRKLILIFCHWLNISISGNFNFFLPTDRQVNKMTDQQTKL